MLYAKALKDGLNEMPTSDLSIRASIEEEAARLGWPAMHEKLADVDPVTAARLHRTDAQRISRALEVYRQTGRPLSSYQSQPTAGTKYRFLTIGLMPGDRKRLHDRIEKRFLQMIEDGFLDEVKALMAQPGFERECPSMRAVGYRQAIEYLSGEITYDEFIAKGVAATRQLAKRQMTWMRSMPDLLTIDPFSEDAFGISLSVIEKARI